ncbi:hypothetical protein [Staphylococcus sp. GDB8P47P]|nr:hypothetical protein [Staphylococcus sp. GDB8P47P]
MMFNKKNWCIIAAISFIVSIGMFYLIKRLYNKRIFNAVSYCPYEKSFD